MHGIRDITTLDGPAFFKLAYRMTAYRGVMRERALLEDQDGTPAARPQAAPEAPVPAAPRRGERQVVPATKTALQSEAAFNGIFSFG